MKARIVMIVGVVMVVASLLNLTPVNAQPGSRGCTDAISQYNFYAWLYNYYIMWGLVFQDGYWDDVANHYLHLMGETGNLIDIYCNGEGYR